MIDKKDPKYKKLVAIAEKTFRLSKEITLLKREKHYIASFILETCRLEAMCYKWLCKLNHLLENNSNILFADKNLNKKTFGRLVKEIKKINQEKNLQVDDKIFERLNKIVKLRNTIIHHILDINVDVGQFPRKRW